MDGQLPLPFPWGFVRFLLFEHAEIAGEPREKKNGGISDEVNKRKCRKPQRKRLLRGIKITSTLHKFLVDSDQYSPAIPDVALQTPTGSGPPISTIGWASLHLHGK